MTEQLKVPAAMWRVLQAARVGMVAMPVHRDRVPRVARIERTLTPVIEEFVTASEELFAFNERRKETLEGHAAQLSKLHRRTLYWLTYVRMDVPGYEASEMASRPVSVKSVIDRAHRVLTLLRLHPADEEPREYAAGLLADLVPLYEQSVRDRDEADAMALQRAQLQARARELMAPVYQNLTTLRTLLRNELGGSHPHVRGLLMDAPKRTKRTESTIEEPALSLLNGSEAPSAEARH
jgi:hypothetical protein